MFVTGHESDFFNTQIAVGEQVRCSLKSLFLDHAAQTNAGMLFEQVLQVRRTKVELLGKIRDIPGRLDLNSLQNLAKSLLLDRGQ